MTQTPGSLEPTFTSDKYKIVYERTEAGYYDIESRIPGTRPLQEFSVHRNKVDFVQWHRIAEETDIAEPRAKAKREPKEVKAVAPITIEGCKTPGCVKAFKHRGRHVFLPVTEERPS